MTLTFNNASQATRWALEWLKTSAGEEGLNGCIDLLLERRFTVTSAEQSEEWMSPKELHRRFAEHLSDGAFHDRMHHSERPYFATRESPKGRLLEVLPNPLLIAWLSAAARPGRRLSRV